MFAGKKALLLDMNSTFMFGEDRFADLEDFSDYYYKIGGQLSKQEVNSIIRRVYQYLSDRYPDEKYRHHFPSLEVAIKTTLALELPLLVTNDGEIERIIDTFSFHECGHIPAEYIAALHALNAKYQLAAVIDIWAPKARWLILFKKLGLDELFLTTSFSSDHGMVKPSAKPYELVLRQLGINKHEGLVIGDSIRRDLGGARAAGIDCILVGGAEHPHALASYKNLLELSEALLKTDN